MKIIHTTLRDGTPIDVLAGDENNTHKIVNGAIVPKTAAELQADNDAAFNQSVRETIKEIEGQNADALVRHSRALLLNANDSVALAGLQAIEDKIIAERAKFIRDANGDVI